MGAFGKDLIKPVTAREMVDAYQTAIREMREAYSILAGAEQRLNAAYGDYNGYGRFSVMDEKIYWDSNRADQIVEGYIEKIKRAAWSRIIDKIQIRQRMSEKRQKQLTDTLEGDDLPDLTVENIYNLLEHYFNDSEEIQRELIDQVFKMLTPQGTWKPYKTNDRFVVGKKVILSGRLRLEYGGGFGVNYYYGEDLNALERVFFILDGAPTPKDCYNSQLADAIDTCKDGTGETDYFEFTCYRNCNLHLKFKRLDLVEKLNAVAGGSSLHEENARQHNLF